MIRNVWAVLCRSASIDQKSNTVSLFEIIEELEGVATPMGLEPESPIGTAIPTQMCVASGWIRCNPEEPTKGKMQVRIVAPGGTDCVPVIPQVVNLAEYKRGRMIARIMSMTYQGDGTYECVVESEDGSGDWKPVASLPFEVSVTVPPIADASQPQ